MWTASTHHDPAAWQEAMKLGEEVYRDTEGFPQEQEYDRQLTYVRSDI
jgi:hypothetical protein